MLKVKRVYEPAEPDDGYRILVDRLWPRGLSRSKAKADLWLKEIAPSNTLRKCYGHEPEKWEEFKKKYSAELATKKALLDQIKQVEKQRRVVTLLFGTRATEYNNAIALKEFLDR